MVPENIAATGTADGFKPEDCSSREVYIWTNDATSMCEFESITLKSNKTDFQNIFFICLGFRRWNDYYKSYIFDNIS